MPGSGSGSGCGCTGIVLLCILLIVLGLILALYALRLLIRGFLRLGADRPRPDLITLGNALTAVGGAVLLFYGLRIVVWAGRGLAANCWNGPCRAIPTF